jgi:SAM-dependent methyltransferase
MDMEVNALAGSNDSGRPAAYWEAIGRQLQASRQGELWRRCNDEIHRMWLGRVAGNLHGALVLKTDLFDEASGDGLVGWFEQRGNRVIGCELAFSTARIALQKQNCRASALCDVRNLPFGAGRFDCVLSNSTLDHFKNEGQVRRSLTELKRVLRPHGTLLLTMDNPRHPLVALRNRFPAVWHRLGVAPYSVGTTCSAEHLKQLLETVGFEVTEVSAILHAPRVLAVALCGWLEKRRGVHQPSGWWLRWLNRFERLGGLPTRQFTGHFVAVVARRRA